MKKIKIDGLEFEHIKSDKNMFDSDLNRIYTKNTNDFTFYHEFCHLKLNKNYYYYWINFHINSFTQMVLQLFCILYLIVLLSLIVNPQNYWVFQHLVFTKGLMFIPFVMFRGIEEIMCDIYGIYRNKFNNNKSKSA